MNMDDILRRLDEWKEKILFGIVLIATVLISLNAEPLGGGISDIDAEARAASIASAGASQEYAERAVNLLEKPTEITPGKVENSDINRPYYDERSAFTPTKASAYTLTVEQYQSLPPIRLEAPGFAPMQDFDTPAGVRPALSRMEGFIPRDARRVELKMAEKDEFGG